MGQGSLVNVTSSDPASDVSRLTILLGSPPLFRKISLHRPLSPFVKGKTSLRSLSSAQGIPPLFLFTPHLLLLEKMDTRYPPLRV